MINLTRNSLSFLWRPEYSNRRFFAVFLLVMGTLIVDVSLAQDADVIVPQAISFWGIVLFVIISAIYMYGAYSIVAMINARNKLSGIRSLGNTSLPNSVRIIAYGLMFIMLLIVLQIAFTANYYRSLLGISVALSYGLAVALMSLLAYKLFSWFKRYKSLIVLLYAIASVLIVINAADSLIFFDVVLFDVRTLMFTPKELLDPEHQPQSIEVTPNSAVIYQTGFDPSTPMYIVAQIQTYSMISYLLVIWGATMMLLRHHMKRVGKLRFWTVTILPLVFLLYYYIATYNMANPTSPVIGATPFDSAIQFLLLAWAIISCGVLFGIGFRSVSRHVKTNSNAKDYMLIAAYGFVLFVNAAQATVLQAGYPSFGLANVSFVGISSYLIFVGVYHSAVSVSQDTKLRQIMKKTANNELEILGDISTGHSRQMIEQKVISASKDLAENMTIEQGVQPSLSENEMRDYLQDVLTEISSKKGKIG